jgi:hypothetical protein
MLKNIFKSAKKLLKNPVVQLGIGALLPGASFMQGLPPFLRNPAVLQGGIGLLAGDKPENVVRNLGIQALLGGAESVMSGGTFAEGATGRFKTPTSIKDLKDAANKARGTGSVVDDIIEGATKLGGSLFFDKDGNFNTELASLALGLYGASQDPSLQDVDPRPLTNITGMTDDYRKSLEESRFQNTGGIAGYLKGGEKLTSIGINSLTGEPSGLVTGPGTGKSDSIRFVSSEAKVPTDISNGEFIITKEATDKIGPENLYALQTAFDKDAETFEEGQERMAMV